MIRASINFFREGDETIDLSDNFDPKEPEIVQIVLTNEKKEKVPVYNISVNNQPIDFLSYSQLQKIHIISGQLLEHDRKYFKSCNRKKNSHQNT